MPLYEYECESCGARFELIQRFADAPADKCRACGGPVHRLLSAPAIQFKGSGWYITDYARKGKSEAPSGTPAGDAKAASTPEGASTEAKPAASTSTTTETKSATTDGK
jgi:putative FmdB family regulatory protein